MAIPNSAVSVSSLVMGTCLPSLKHNASKFKVQFLYFDQYLKMYFRKNFEVLAYDPKKICKTGDVALIQKLPTSISKLINYKVLEVVYPFGDITDPISGKKVVASMFRDEIEMRNSLYGKTDSSFSYEKAPQRGWQEGKRDFSHRRIYRKYNEFDEGDDNQNQPYAKVN